MFGAVSGSSSGIAYDRELLGNAAELRIAFVDLVKDKTDTQYDNWANGNAFFAIGGQEMAPVGQPLLLRRRKGMLA